MRSKERLKFTRFYFILGWESFQLRKFVGRASEGESVIQDGGNSCCIRDHEDLCRDCTERTVGGIHIYLPEIFNIPRYVV